MSGSTKSDSLALLLSRPIKALPRYVFMVAVLLLLAAVGDAQTASTLSGTVKDPSGALVPGAAVVLTNVDSKAKYSLKSNGEGFFQFASVVPATYSLRVSEAGFENSVITGIVIHAGDNLTVPRIVLKIGQTDVSITVTAESAGVALDSPEHSTLITADDIKRLSTQGRDVSELLTILPGFSTNAGSNINNEGPGGLYGYQTMGFGSGQVNNLGANGSAPQSGAVNISSDGANLIDPGDMGGQVSNVNMDQVQEVKVQTSNFGADQAKGPIVINALGKSGSSQFHGGLYTYFRNSALNSNDWLSKYYGSARPELKYFYPGGTLGGPVLIPGTNFNKNKELVFWTGFEYYGQDASQGLLTAFIPTPAMMAGDLSNNTIASALHVDPTEMATNCSADYNIGSKYTNVGGMCYSPNGSIDQTGAIVNNGQLKNIDPGTRTISNLWPLANRTPQPVYVNGAVQYATDGVNYAKNIISSHNGFQLHTRVDENLTDTVKLYGTFNWEKINDEAPTNNIYYNPTGTIPYPSPEFSNGRAYYLTVGLNKTFSSTLTNELAVSGVYYNQPKQFADPAATQTDNTAWGAAGYTGGHFHQGTQLPRVIDYESVGIPGFSFGYVPPTGEYLKKFDLNISENVTKVYKTHTIKFGVYAENAGNSNLTIASQYNGTLTYMRWDGCLVNQTSEIPGGAAPPTAGLGNVIGNFLIGCPLGYQQDSSNPVQDVRYKSIEGYGTDAWKVNSKLTLTLGIRLSHIAPWTDAHGIGLAVWDPSGLAPHTIYPDSASNTTWPGISWHQQNPEIPVAGVPTKGLSYMPRVGLAYDLYGDGKTTLRGGWGMYYFHDAVNAAGGALATASGLQTYTTPSTTSCTLGQLFTNQYLPCGYYASTPTSITPFVVSALDPKDNRLPLTYNYNFTLDQQLRWKTVMEISYVGNQGANLLTLGNLQNQNVIPLGAEFLPDPVTGVLNSSTNISNYADYRPYPNYQQVNVPTHIGWSNYNALQASLNRQTGSVTFGVNYTWSKAMGVRGNYDSGNIADPIDPRHDYGVLAFDRPQALNVTYSYQEGTKYQGNRLLGLALNGWELSGIATVQSGPDLSILNGTTNFGLGSGGSGINYVSGGTTVGVPISQNSWLGSNDYNLQPTVTCDPRNGLKKNQFVNGSCFGLPQIGTQGWWNLPDVHGPAYYKWDMSVFKNFAITEHQHVQFRVSGFNFLNHPLTSFNSANTSTLNLIAGCSSTGTNCPTYTTPGQAIEHAVISNASVFGSTQFKTGVRILELALKYDF